MSTKTKTGAKLVDSMKKSKSGAVARKTAERPDAAKSTTSKSKTSTSKPASKSASRTSTNPARNTGFSHGRRVWPD